MKRYNEAAVGLAVLLAFVVVMVGAIFLSQTSFRERDLVQVARFRSIGGLNAGAPVTRSGVRVGRVTAVRLAPDDWVEVEIALSSSVELPQEPVVIAASASLFGEWQATIISRTAAPEDQTVRALLAEAALVGGNAWPGAILPDISELTSQANRIANNVSSITERVEGTLDEQVMADLRETVASIRKMSQSLATFTDQQATVLTRLSENLATTAGVVNEFSLATRTVMQRVDSSTAAGELGQVIANSAASTADLREVAANLRAVSTTLADQRVSMANTLSSVDTVLARMKDGRGTLSLLASDSTLYLETRNTLTQFRELLADIKANPRRYLKFSVF
ncbi:MAG: MlaD family protein [Gemmatimonadota bacterium]|nr:MlaD family protein [Gemmatimonadota bacterium]